MNRNKLIESLRKIDFKIGKDGFIHGSNDLFYGYIRNNDIRTESGEYVSFMDAVSVEFEGMDNTLVLIKGDGTVLNTLSGAWVDPTYAKTKVNDGVIEVNKAPIFDSELNDAFSILYPNSYDHLYYDVLKEKEMVNLRMFDLDNVDVPITDEIENIYFDHIERRLKLLNFIGKPPAIEVRRRVLSFQTHKHKRNKFREWVESIVWDGKPRIATWFKKVFSAQAPPLQELGLEDEYLAKVAEAWFIGGIKRMYTPTQHDVIPVLIGGQGIGKSTGLKYTAGSPEWFGPTTINISTTDGVAKFLDSVRGRIVVELAEASSIRSADQEALKAFISKTEDQYRKPYARRDESFPRHFIMASTTNIPNVFTDITGNRRFYPMYCKPPKGKNRYGDRKQEDVEQVWAEALALYRQSQEKGDGEHVWYLPNTWKPAVIMQKFATQDNLNISLIEDWLDNPANGYTQIGSRITRDMIIDECFGLDHTKPLPQSYTASLKAWMNGTVNWQKTMGRMGKGKDRKPSRGWERINEPGSDFVYDDEEIEDTIKMIEDDMTEKECGIDLIRIMRDRAVKYGFKDMGDLFPLEGLSQQVIDMLYNEGYIYDAGMGDYRLGVLP